MKIKTLIILSFILALLLGYVYFYERHLPGTEKKREMAKRIFSFDLNNVTSLELKNKYGFFVLEKNQKNDQWYFTEPAHVRADGEEIKAILTDMQFVEFERAVPANEVNSKLLGLDTPVVTLKFSDIKNEFFIEFGANTALGANSYARAVSSQKKQVYVVEEFGIEKMEKTFFDLRSKNMFPPFSYLPDNLTIFRDGLKIELKCMSNTIWEIVSPLKRRADQTKVREILTAFENLKIIEFKDDSSAPPLGMYGLDSPRLIINVQHNNDESFILTLGNVYSNETRCYAKNNYEPNVYGLETKATRPFFSSLFELSTKNIFFITADVIRAVRVNSNLCSFEIEDRGGKWWFTEPAQIEADGEKIEQFFESLRSYEIKEYVIDRKVIDTIQSSLKANSYNVIITDKNSKTPLRYVFYPDPASQKVYASREDTGSFWQISIDKAHQLPTSLIPLIKKDILDINRYTLEKLEFKTGNMHSELILQNNQWYSGGSPLAQNEIEEILARIQKLVINDIIAIEDKDLMKKYELVQPQTVITMTFLEGQKNTRRTVVLDLGKIDDNKIFCRKAGYPLIFTLDNAQVSALRDAVVKPHLN